MVCGFWRYKFYVDIRRGLLVRWCQMRVRSSKMRVFSVDRNIFHMKFFTGFTYRNLRGFAQFPGDSMALVYVSESGVTLVTSSMQYYWFFGHKYFCPVCILLLLFLVLTWLILRRSHHRLKILVRVYLKTYFSCVLANSVSVIVTHQSILTVIHPYQSLLDLVFI